MSSLHWSQTDYAPTLAEAERDAADDLVADLCPGDEACEVAVRCVGCGDTVCPEHSDEFVTCAGDRPHAVHHWECRGSCPECQEAFRVDRAEKSREDWSE